MEPVQPAMPRFLITAAVVIAVLLTLGFAVLVGGDDESDPGADLAAGTGLPKLPGPGDAGEARAMLAPVSPIEYRVEGELPELPGTAAAYRLAGPDSGDRLAALAEALGVQPRRILLDRASGRWTHGDPMVACAGPAMPPDAPVSSDDPIGAGCPPEILNPSGPPDVSRERAEGMARAILAAIGVDAEGAEVSVNPMSDSWHVVVEPAVEGVATQGYEFSFDIGTGERVVRSHGMLGQPERLGNYPLVGTAEGLRRLRDDVRVGPQPLAAAEPAYTGGQPLVRVVQDVRLGLLDDVLVPVYVFVTADGAEIPVPAVTDEHLERPISDQPDRPEPFPEPAPVPGGGTAGSSGQSEACTGSSSSHAGGGQARSTSVKLCVEPTSARVGDDVRFEVGAEGCDGPVLDTGDGTTLPIDGSTLVHRYQRPGSYQVRVRFTGCPEQQGGPVVGVRVSG
jgi:hypothetical protein